MNTHLSYATAACALMAGVAIADDSTAGQTALVLYETQGSAEDRREGLAFVEIDPHAAEFGDILADIPLPPDFVGHHLFYSPDRKKAYVTGLGRSELLVLDVTATPWRKSWVPVPTCMVGEDIAFSDDGTRWYLTCLGSSVVVVGDAETDAVIDTWEMSEPWTHGIAVREDLGQILVTSTANPANPQELGGSILAIDNETGELIQSYLTTDDAPAGTVEIFFLPETEVPMAYVTNLAGDMWLAAWNEAETRFDLSRAFNLREGGHGMALEVYFGDGDLAYVTTAVPGAIHVLDISCPAAPELVRSIATKPGAHHATGGHALRLRAERADEPRGHQRRFDHRGGPRDRRAGREHRDVQGTGPHGKHDRGPP